MRLRSLVPLLIVLLSLGGTHTWAATQLPNVIVIVTDDMPALDGRLTQQLPVIRSTFIDHAITFEDFHSESPLCCPARAGFLTGQHTHNHGVTANAAGMFDPAMTLATQLHTAGYFTFLTGKYLNKYGGPCSQHPENCAPNVPTGWDHFAAFGEPGYYNYTLWKDGQPTFHAATTADYSTDVISSQTIAWLKAAPAMDPIFAWVAAYSPHDPTKIAARYATASCKTSRWSPPSWNEADVSDKPAYVQAKPLLTTHPPNFSKACRSLLAVDDLVAAIRSQLAADGRLDNTILIFTGDNGMLNGEHRLQKKEAPYETRIPFYLSWPARYGTAPRTIGERIQNIDLAPTICDLAGCTLGPYPNGQTRPDGITFTCLLDETCATLGRDAVLDEMPTTKNTTGIPDWWAVTTTSVSTLGRWHYIEYETGERELYDLTADPWELENQSGNPADADIVAALHGRLAELKTERG